MATAPDEKKEKKSWVAKGWKEPDRTGLNRLEEHFLDRAKRGVVLSLGDLVRLRNRWGLEVPTSELKKYRYRWKFVAIHSKFERPAHFMTASVDKLGNVMLDMAMFKPHLKRFNRQCKYFLVGVDCLSQKMACYPFANKSRVSWEKGALSMIANDFPVVKTFITDRDTAISGKAFQDRILEQRGVSWIHLMNREKAFLAENGIGIMKERLDMACASDNNWVDKIADILEAYNDRFVTGTNIRRRDVNKDNWIKVLMQRYDTRDPYPLFNLGQAGNLSEGRQRRLRFRFAVGDKVRLSNRANYTTKGSAFWKSSEKGSYGPRVYEVEEVRLKSNKDLFLSKVYALKGLKGLFYETELIPAYLPE
jgi:hypothetical protein